MVSKLRYIVISVMRQRIVADHPETFPVRTAKAAVHLEHVLRN